MALRAATLSRRMPGRKAPHRALYILEPRGETSRLARGALADSVKRNGAQDGALGCVVGVWASDYTPAVAGKVASEGVFFRHFAVRIPNLGRNRPRVWKKLRASYRSMVYW